MRDFKFFRKEVKTPIHSDTPEGYMLRRHLYHTNPQEYRRINGGMYQEEILRRRHQSFQSISETKWKQIESRFKKLLNEPMLIGIVLTSIVVTLSIILILGKILNVW